MTWAQRYVRFYIPEKGLQTMAAHEEYYNPNMVKLLRSAWEKSGGKRPVRLHQEEFSAVLEGLDTAFHRMQEEKRNYGYNLVAEIQKGRAEGRADEDVLRDLDAMDEKKAELDLLIIDNLTVLEIITRSAGELH